LRKKETSQTLSFFLSFDASLTRLEKEVFLFSKKEGYGSAKNFTQEEIERDFQSKFHLWLICEFILHIIREGISGPQVLWIPPGGEIDESSVVRQRFSL
jgi:hypothetical protein